MPGRFNPDDYVDVQDRINRFWSENANGSIVTELLSTGDNFDRVVVRAKVYKTHQLDSGFLPDATGIAAEERGPDKYAGANFTSWHENAETSAIGRALANMGYATSRQDRPSRQEMAKVNAGDDLPARTRTTSQNTIPTDVAGSWTEFWKVVEATGLPRDKAELERSMGQSLGADPSYAFERFQAWRKDMAEQQVLA